MGTAGLKQKMKAVSLAMRPQVKLEDLLTVLGDTETLLYTKSGRRDEVIESAEIRIKYKGYIEREKLLAEKITRLESLKLPDDLEYAELTSISTEGRQKLAKHKPTTIGQASRISGVSPSDISILLMYLGR